MWERFKRNDTSFFNFCCGSVVGVNSCVCEGGWGGVSDRNKTDRSPAWIDRSVSKDTPRESIMHLSDIFDRNMISALIYISRISLDGSAGDRDAGSKFS